jgi:hypothetical protein
MKIFVKQQHDDAKLTAAVIQMMLKEGDHNVVSKMRNCEPRVDGYDTRVALEHRLTQRLWNRHMTVDSPRQRRRNGASL